MLKKKKVWDSQTPSMEDKDRTFFKILIVYNLNQYTTKT